MGQEGNSPGGGVEQGPPGAGVGSLHTQIPRPLSAGAGPQQSAQGAGAAPSHSQTPGQRPLTAFAGFGALAGTRNTQHFNLDDGDHGVSATQGVAQPGAEDLAEAKMMQMFSRLLDTKLQEALAPVGTDIAAMRNSLVECRDHITPLEANFASLNQTVAGLQQQVTGQTGAGA